MASTTFSKAAWIGVLSLALVGCGKRQFPEEKDLLSASAHCVSASEFGECLLSSFVNHTASLSIPEKLEFSPYYDRIANAGYDREQRRKEVNKYIDNDFGKKQNDSRFLLSDMYRLARRKTPEDTRKAIAILQNDPHTFPTARRFSPVLEQWLKNSDIYDDEFAHALLVKFREARMLDISIWNEPPGLMVGQSSFEVLSAAFEKIGDQSTADDLISEMKEKKHYPLREILEPVFSGDLELTELDGRALKKVDFFVSAIKPIIDQKIAAREPPSSVFNDLVFATRHGFSDFKSDKIVNDALSYAYERNDELAIKDFANRTLLSPIDFSNGTIVTVDRAHKLAEDLVLVQYLDALGDSTRIESFAEKWAQLSQRMPDGDFPSRTGTTIGDYTRILHQTGRTSDIEAFLRTMGDEGLIVKNDVEWLARRPPTLATTVERLVQLENETARQGDQLDQRFYKNCARVGGISTQKYEVRLYCLSKIKEPSERVIIKLKLASSLYEVEDVERGRELTKQVLKEAATCACLEEKSLSDQAYMLEEIILSELKSGTL